MTVSKNYKYENFKDVFSIFFYELTFFLKTDVFTLVKYAWKT